MGSLRENSMYNAHTEIFKDEFFKEYGCTPEEWVQQQSKVQSDILLQRYMISTVVENVCTKYNCHPPKEDLFHVDVRKNIAIRKDNMDTIRTLILKKFPYKLSKMPNRKIIFSGYNKDGKSVCVCLPESKYYTDKDYNWWIDITQIQMDIFKKYQMVYIMLLLENGWVCQINWNTLKKYFIPEARQYNEQEREHWKMYIYNDYIYIKDNSNKLYLSQKNRVEL